MVQNETLDLWLHAAKHSALHTFRTAVSFDTLLNDTPCCTTHTHPTPPTRHHNNHTAATDATLEGLKSLSEYAAAFSADL